MGSSATRSKQRWNSKNYVQVKVSVAPDVAATFKTACAASNVSMAGKLSQLMSEYSGLVHDGAAGVAEQLDCSTRRKRREAVNHTILLLCSVRDGENGFLDRAPDNLKSAPIYDSAEEIVSQLDESIEALESLY